MSAVVRIYGPPAFACSVSIASEFGLGASRSTCTARPARSKSAHAGLDFGSVFSSIGLVVSHRSSVHSHARSWSSARASRSFRGVAPQSCMLLLQLTSYIARLVAATIVYASNMRGVSA
jgi:hypothetical protein